MEISTLLRHSPKIRPCLQNAINKLCLGHSKRSKSTFSKDGREEAVVVSEDGNIVVCWHPEPVVPYEFSKPIPVEAADASALKFKYDDDMKDTFRKVHPYFEMKKLQSLTYTNKHIWFPQKKDKLIKFKEKVPRDREYL